MAFRPNFGTVVLEDGGILEVMGVSDDDDLPIELQVYIAQDFDDSDGEATFASASLSPVLDQWTVNVSGGKFKKGPAVAVGIEVRNNPVTLTTWTEPVRIT